MANTFLKHASVISSLQYLFFLSKLGVLHIFQLAITMAMAKYILTL